MSSEITLEYLRREAKDSHLAAKAAALEAANNGDSEQWDLSRIMLGEAFAYEQMIKYMRGLKEREFQLAKKKGTL